jgi:AraC-like DNA-binding protein
MRYCVAVPYKGSSACLKLIAGTRIRLERAAGYLCSADLSIEAIAGRTGYASSAALSKAFKREFGVSPGTYRRGSMPVHVHDLPAPVG